MDYLHRGGLSETNIVIIIGVYVSLQRSVINVAFNLVFGGFEASAVSGPLTFSKNPRVEFRGFGFDNSPIILPAQC